MANRGAYGFNGTFYNTREEAEQAREQAKAAQEAQNRQRYAEYIDAYSVGFDKNKYDALIASGQGVSSISDNEANYIRSKFTPSYSTKYKNSATDQYLASVGLPPSADLSKYRDAYTKYTSSGSAQDVYGFLSNDDWNKINELWSKDWQYGLTNEDFIRQQYGYAPVSYDSMYEDTLLDDQLKAAHLPPSKLLNGKLGEAYTTYVNNGNKYNEFMTDAINRKIEEDERLQSQSKNPVMPSVNGEVEERPTSYSLEQAINDMRTSEKWSAWAAEHFGSRMELPNQFSDDYLMMDDSGYVALRDANGQKMYDYEKYNKDLKKAQDNNAKLDADDWAITYDKAQSFYDQNYSTIKSLYDAQNQLAAQGISAPTQEQYLDAFQNAYIANSINGGNGFTVDDLFPNLDEQDKGRYQKYVDKTNMLMRTQGYNAAVNYINGGELASELRAAQESEWVAAYRKEFADVEEAQSKTDEQIIQSHYDKYKTAYGMTDEEVKQLRDGSLSLPEYLGANVKTSEDAQMFATDRIARELASKGLPTTQDELQKESDRLAEQIENLSFAEIEFVPEDRFFSEQELAKFRSEVTPEYYNDYINEKKRERLNELASKKSEIDVTLNTWHAKETAYYVDAVQYTDDFKKKTEDMEYVNEQFNKIVDGWNNSLFGGEADALKTYATDDEKRALVYMADTTMYRDEYVPDENGNRGQVSYKARNYLNDVLMRGWDAKRNQQKIEQQDWYNDEDTSAVWKVLGGIGRTFAAITYQPTEAVVNAMFDTARMIGGKDIYASSRMTWADTEISNIANHISEDAGQGWATAYQMIPSMAQSAGGAVLAYFTGGASEAATLALMATQAYSSTVTEALQNGASSKEAFAYGIAAGAAEALFEKVSLESLTTGMKGVSDVLATATDVTKKEAAKQIVTTMLKNTVVQGLTEGSEELFTSLANDLTERLILRYNASAEKLKQHYIDAGLDEKEAEKRVAEDNIKSLAMDFALGVASGALMAFGSNLVITGNTVKMDSYKLDSFMHDVHDLSAVPVNEAVTYAKNNAKITNDGITVDSAREVFSELYRRGADAATLSRVRNEVTTENTGSDVMTEIDSIIRKASVRDQKSLINAASKALAKKGVSQQQINSAVESYVNQLSTVVQQSDYAAIDASVAQMQDGFINDLIRNSGRTSVQGAQIINDYIKQNQDAVKAGAREYINKFNANKNLSKAQAADYANYASALTLMTSDQNFVTALVSQFGEQASNVSEAVRNAVLNSADGASTQFIQAVVDSVGQIEMNGNETSLTSIFSQDMDMTAYVAAQLAMAAQHKENAASRSIYDNITMYGTSEAMLDTLTAVNRYEGILAKQRSAANAKANAATDAIKPTSDVATKNARKTKARKNAANKKAAVESRKARNAEAEAESASNVARYDAEYDSFFSDNRIDADGNIVRSIPANMVEAAERVNAAREQAISAYSKLVEENRGRLLGAETDSRNADDEYMELAKEVNGAFDVYSAAYVNMFGAQIEAMRAGKSVSTAEMNRLTALVQNGVTSDINSVTAKINAAEKRSAVALGNALGADVEIASFTKEFAKERGIDVQASDSGFTQYGKIFLNADMFNGTVGYGTGAVLQHEFAHVLETSAEQYSRYEKFALDYLTKTQGKDFVKNAVKATIESAAAKGRTLTEEAAQHEIVAEFSRTYMLTDPRAINAMCSKAPVMSTRILQWLTNTKAAFGNGVSQGSLLNRAQLAYARALKKLDVKADSPSDITSVQNANAAFDNEQSVIKANPEIKTEAVATTEATEQKAEQTKEEPKAPDGYEFVNNEDGYEWTDQTVPASEILSDEELAASYDEVLNEEEARVTAEAEASTEEEAPAEQTEEAEQLAETEAQPEVEPAVETEEAEQPTEDFAEYAEEDTYEPKYTNELTVKDTIRPILDSYIKSLTTSDFRAKKPTYSEKTAKNRAERLLKSKESKARPILQYAYMDENGRQTVTDSYRMYRFNKALDLPAVPDGERYIDVDRVFNESKNNDIPLETPNIETLKALAKNKGLYNFGDDLPVVNSKYLLELLETFPDAKLYAASKNTKIKPIYVASENGDGLLVPVRMFDKQEANEKARTIKEIKPVIEQYAKNGGYNLSNAQIDAFIENYLEGYVSGDGDRAILERVKATPKAETQSTETVAENATVEQAEPQSKETQTASLPFDLPQKTIDTISRFVEIQKSKAVGGKVSADVNDTIRGVVKYQVNKAAKEAGVTVTDEQIKQYADTWTLEQSSAETKKAGSSRIDNYKPTKTKTRTTAESFMNAAAVEERQENTLRKAVNGLGGEQRVMYGTPKVLNEGKGVMVSRTVSVKGLQTGNANADGDRTIAMIARADKFLFGNDVDLRRSLKLEDCYAVVIPNSTAYANIREQAREAGLVVMSYDPADALSFDRAQKSAARSSAVQYFPDSGTTLEALIKKYGSHPVGSEPRVDNRPMPKRTSDTNRVSRAMRTVAESQNTSDAYYDYMTGAVQRGVGTYVPSSNNETLNTAREDVARFANIVDASNALHNEIASGRPSNKDLIARAETLWMDAQFNDTLTKEQHDQILSDLAILSTDTGTSLQLLKEIKRMTPDGRINYLNTIGEREAAKYKKRTGKNVTLNVTEEEAEAIRKARNNEERTKAETDVYNRWEEEMPLTLADHIRNWRYLSMLGNPRTHFRNMIGNVLMYGAARAKDVVNTGYQRLFNVDEADRTTSWKMGAPSEAAKTFVSDVLKEALPTMQGVSEKYIQNSKSNTDITKGKTWIGRLLNNLAAFNSNALEAEDKNFLSLRFKSAMYQMIRAQNIDVNNITDEQRAKLIGYASEEALRATFRDANKVADALNKAAGSSKIVEYALEAIVPFKKTPANIVKRSIEYSPLGLGQAAYKGAKSAIDYNKELKRIDNIKGITDQQREEMRAKAKSEFVAEKIQAIDRLAAGTTGSAMMALGVLLSSLGVISITKKKDKGSQFESALGRNSYSLNIGDLSIDLSAFSPAAVPFIMGAELNDNIKNNEAVSVSDVINMLCEVVDPISEMSMVSGIADALKTNSYNNGDASTTTWASDIAKNAVSSYIGQFVPTAFGQLTRTFDPYQRSYSAGDDYFASQLTGSSDVGNAVKSLQNKTPLAAFSEPKVNLHGDEQRSYTNLGEWFLNALNNNVLPATIKVDAKNDIDDELIRLYDAVDSDKLFPTKPSRNLGSETINGEKVTYKITNDADYTQYQKEYGQTVYDMLEEFMLSKSYAQMNDTQRAEAIEDIISDAYTATRKRWKAILASRAK